MPQHTNPTSPNEPEEPDNYQSILIGSSRSPSQLWYQSKWATSTSMVATLIFIPLAIYFQSAKRGANSLSPVIPQSNL